ncbi:HWE histidine kinase domain-containing protein [Blastochloris sulfoviridis]|nr:HWE histidine kinase domain-containing protein [Blastochloris sulfoviridis]
MRRRPAKVLAAAAVLLPITIFLAEAVLDYRQTAEKVRDDVEAKTEALANHAEAVLRSIRVVMARVEDRVGRQPWDAVRGSAELRAYLDEVRAEIPEIESIYVVGPDAHRVSAGGVFRALPAEETGAEPGAAEPGTALRVGSAASLPEGGAAAFTLSRPLRRDGGFAGDVGVAVSARPFEALLRSAGGGRDAAVALVRTDGTVLVRQSLLDRHTLSREAGGALSAARAADGQAGSNEGEAAPDSSSGIAAVRKLDGAPLAVAYSVPAVAVHGPWLQRMAALAALALMTSVTLMWAGRRALQDARSELDLGRAHLEGVVRAMPIGVIVAEAPSGRLVLANDQVGRILRAPADPSGGIDAYSNLVGLHPDGRRLAPEEWPLARVLGSGEGAPEQEIRVLRGDGSRGIIAVNSAPVRDRSGALVAAVVAFYDITARKDSQVRVEMLMRETLHRAKNQLAVVEGMARQTGRIASGIDDFLDRFSERLQGLALTQTLLVERQWESVRLKDLLIAQMTAFPAPLGDRIDLDGPEVEVAPEPAHNLGLAFHELARNAVQYGALSDGAGRIRVHWGAGSGGRFRLEWVEEGGPPIETPPIERGFGSMVLTRVAGAAVDGTVTMEFNRSGLVWRLDGSARYFH